MTAEPALRLVDPDTGEIITPGCPDCRALATRLWNSEQDNRRLEKDLRAWRAKYDRLLTDKDEERMADPQRQQIIEVFDHWRDKCKHPNARFDSKRFDLIKARLRDFTPDELKMAIDGAAVDAYTDDKGKRHDRLGLILESAERVEDFANRYARWRKRNDA